TQQLCPRDLAILERGLAIPQAISLSVRTDEVSRKVDNVKNTTQHSGGVDIINSKTQGGNRTKQGDNVTLKPPRTFADRIAGSPQLVSATITRAIKAKAHRERQAARKPVMAVRMAGSK
ncbi:MAG: hypothetical protein P8N43_09700, partial [Alphaproteobacteria bacterium]|nr:hypothetical protein [Alphaproteobacteria bacterium]